MQQYLHSKIGNRRANRAVDDKASEGSNKRACKIKEPGTYMRDSVQEAVLKRQLQTRSTNLSRESSRQDDRKRQGTPNSQVQ